MGRLSTARLAACIASALMIAACGNAVIDAQTAPAPTGGPLAITPEDPSLQWGPCPDIFPAGCEIAVLHGNPAQANADVFLRVAGGYEIPAHSHTSAERMLLARGELVVRYQGALETTLTAGQYAYGPAGLPHRARCASATPCTLFIAFEGPVDAAAFAGSLD